MIHSFGQFGGEHYLSTCHSADQGKLAGQSCQTYNLRSRHDKHERNAMQFPLAGHVLLTGAVFAILQATPAAAQVDAVRAIREAAIIDVPLVLGQIESGLGEGTLWAKGDRPANTLFARFSVQPVQVAALAGGADKAEVILWRAFPGGGVGRMRADELDLAQGPRYFCGVGAGIVAPACFVDEDADGRFDRVAEAIAERGRNLYHLTVIKASRPLGTPVAYRILADDQRPVITIELNNCAKDYDRPRFTARSISDRLVPRSPATFAWIEKDSTFAACRRSTRLDTAPTGAQTPPPGGFFAEIGPFAFAIGAKNDSRFILLGPVEPQALYRIEGDSLVDMSVGFTPDQAKLAALKKFPYPIMITDPGAVIHTGRVAKGTSMATIPFHHAYRGKLTQDVTISTLFGKRSVAAGTIVYGFPARSSISTSRGGIPNIPSVGDEDFRKVNLELTWCTAVRQEVSKKGKPDPVGRNGWAAACIPHSVLGNYTILTDRQPAFGISSLSYNAATSSNNGRPPIERTDEASFSELLRLDYVYEGRDGEFIVLAEQIRYGEELTSSRLQRIYAPGGTMIVTLAGASLSLASTDAGGLTVKAAGPTVSGTNPLLQWDQRAMLQNQLEKLGLHMEDEGTNRDGNQSAILLGE